MSFVVQEVLSRWEIRQLAGVITPRDVFHPLLGPVLAKKNCKRRCGQTLVVCGCWLWSCIVTGPGARPGLCLLSRASQENDRDSNSGAHVGGSELGSRSKHSDSGRSQAMHTHTLSISTW